MTRELIGVPAPSLDIDDESTYVPDVDELSYPTVTAPRGPHGKATIWNEDCITGMPSRLDAESVDLVVSSIPFGALFMYSGKPTDIGNNADGIDMKASDFGLHMRFFLKQLARVMKPGTLFCCHVQQLLTLKVQHGYMGRRDFRGAVIDLCGNAGLLFTGEVSIPKNPQRIAQAQKLHSLLFVTGRADSRKLSPAVNDFLLIFKKPGEATPVPALYEATRNPGGWVTTNEWIKWAHGTWADIRETDILDGYKSAREDDSEKHVCPLQLEVIRRCIRLYTNPGELVLDPFSGIGSSGYVALEQHRSFVGFELKESYFKQMEANLAKIQREMERGQEAQAEPSLFDGIWAEAPAAYGTADKAQQDSLVDSPPLLKEIPETVECDG